MAEEKWKSCKGIGNVDWEVSNGLFEGTVAEEARLSPALRLNRTQICCRGEVKERAFEAILECRLVMERTAQRTAEKRVQTELMRFISKPCMAELGLFIVPSA